MEDRGVLFRVNAERRRGDRKEKVLASSLCRQDWEWPSFVCLVYKIVIKLE